jgi:hypothetical protein
MICFFIAVLFLWVENNSSATKAGKFYVEKEDRTTALRKVTGKLNVY